MAPSPQARSASWGRSRTSASPPRAKGCQTTGRATSRAPQTGFDRPHTGPGRPRWCPLAAACRARDRPEPPAPTRGRSIPGSSPCGTPTDRWPGFTSAWRGL